MTKQSFKLFDFQILDRAKEDAIINSDSSDDSSLDNEDVKFKAKKDNKKFEIQMFGLNEQGKTCFFICK